MCTVLMRTPHTTEYSATVRRLLIFW